MNKKRIYLIILGILIMIVLALIILTYDKDLYKNYACIKHKEFFKEKWEGIVNEKYLDNSNHNAETIRLQSQINYVMFMDGSAFFKFIEKGDSIVKITNTDIINVYRNGNKYEFKIYFGCDETNANKN